MKIVIETIPYKKMRYPTEGDYWVEKDGTVQFRVYESDPKEEWLIAIHEIVEYFLVSQKGIKMEVIDKFDKELDKSHWELEPGDQNNAPYYYQHQIATLVEQIIKIAMLK